MGNAFSSKKADGQVAPAPAAAEGSQTKSTKTDDALGNLSYAIDKQNAKLAQVIYTRYPPIISFLRV